MPSLRSTANFSGYLLHGENANNKLDSFKKESYSYVLLPSMNSEEVKAYAENPDIRCSVLILLHISQVLCIRLVGHIISCQAVRIDLPHLRQ